MNIQAENSKTQPGFFIEENGQKVAEIGFVLQESKYLIIQHTEVAPELEGKGIGKKLVLKVVEYARENKLLIKPVCSYAAKVLRGEEFKDILA